MQQSRRPVTIKDVAAAAGVSIATVSRARTNPGLLHADTLAKVDQAIATLGYQPNEIARDLRRAETKLVMVIVPRLSPYFLDIFRGVEVAADEVGYGVLVGHTDRDGAREMAFVNQVSSRRADGIILATSVDSGAIHRTRSRVPPVVLALDGCDSGVLPSVFIDHESAAVLATRHLIELGHRRIGHIAGAGASAMARERMEGFRRALAEGGVPFDPELCVQGDFTVESGEVGMAQLLARSVRPTAVFAANDETAIGAMRTLKRAGLRVPHDMSLVGFDDQRIAALADPPLTTIGVPTYEIGYRSMMKLNSILTGHPPVRRTVLESQLIVRGSSGPPAQV